MDDELIADMLGRNGEFARWLDREKQIYLAHAGRDGTRDGFKAHVRKLFEENPDKLKAMMLGDLAETVFEEDF